MYPSENLGFQCLSTHSPFCVPQGRQLSHTSRLRDPVLFHKILEVKKGRDLSGAREGMMWVSRPDLGAEASATTSLPPGLSTGWHREQGSNNHLLRECSKWDDTSKVLCIVLSKPGAAIITIDKKVLGSQLPVIPLYRISLPRLFLLVYGVFWTIDMTALPPSLCQFWHLPCGSDSLLTHSLGIGVVLTVSRLCFSPPGWGEVSTLVKLGCLVFGVSHGVSRDTALSSSEMCCLGPRPETLTEVSYLCHLAIGLFPGL